jgi:hypothetical protein
MFRFTIRDVLWLTVVVGLGVGWALDHRVQLSERQSLRRYNSLHKWYVNAMAVMIASEGYRLDNIGPGPYATIRTPEGNVLSSDDFGFGDPPK